MAVPHAKTEAAKKLHVAFGRSSGGVDFQSPDGEKARLFFIMVSPRNTSGPHIKALAQISKLIKRKQVRDELLSCQDNRDLIEAIRRAEKEYL